MYGVQLQLINLSYNLYTKARGMSQMRGGKTVRARGPKQNVCYEMVSSVYDKEAISGRYQQYGSLNNTLKVTDNTN